MNEKLKNKKWSLFFLIGIFLMMGIISITYYFLEKEQKEESLIVAYSETTERAIETTEEEPEITEEASVTTEEVVAESAIDEMIEPETTEFTTIEPTTIAVATPKVAESNLTKDKKLVGYYAAWATYSGYSPDKLSPNKVTHINYAFANIGDDLKISMGYPDIDPGNFKKLRRLKQENPNLKTLIAVGGWTWSGKFSDVALTEESRNIFADSCVDFIVEHEFDGIDIDWEYPVSGGMATNSKRPEDKQNFTLLLKTLREKLDARGAVDQKAYLLTIAGGAGSGFINNTEVSAFHQYLDYANIMTYDIHGTWDKYTDFNAPLYNNGDNSLQYKWSADAAVGAWIEKGFPKEKIVLGIPFFGHIYHQVTNINRGLYQTFSDGKSISYGDIASKYLNSSDFTRYYHGESKVPWLYDGSTFISYEDEGSVTLKIEYINTKGLGGAFVWELSQDPNQVLLDEINRSLP